ncbi:MAG: apolipoprotein N-acyltransferase [Actinobacteria bacterium]|nr:apolipoprotein N-acyltransferase [Actinomycetota bacterium]MCA1719985.1 apolipoprotein N-acyltransferase [Actinomycetota bacterium]
MTTTAPVLRAPAAAAPGQRPARWMRLVAAVAAGLLMDLVFPPHDLWFLAPAAVGLLTLACRGTTARTGALAGLLGGLAFFVPLLVWSGAVAGPPAWLALAVLQALFFAPLGAALSVVTRLRGWPVWAAALWVGEEALRDRIPFGGFPWGRLAFSQGDSWLTPLAALGGAPLVTFGVALLGTALAGLAVRQLVVPLVAAAVVLVAAPLVPTPTGGQPVTVAVVQGNVPRLGLDAFSQRAAVLDNHADATHRLAADVRAGKVPRPDLVVWPENASDLDPYTDPQAAETIGAAVKDVGVPVLVGAVLEGPRDKVRNAGIVWDPLTGAGATYVKRHPVPFGEYMPYRSLLRRISKKVDLVPRDFAAGRVPGTLTVGPAPLADVICFEVAYDGVVRDAVRGGGRLLVVQTNNATFGRSGETSQQLAMGRLRAVEHGRAVLVAATSGVSAVIAPDGRLVERSRVFTQDVLVQQVPLRSGSTLATRLGLLPELLLAALGAAALLVGLVRR